MTCTENFFNILTAIQAYPASAVTFAEPMSVFRKTIGYALFSLDATQAIEVPFDKKTVKLSEKAKTATAGDYYEVTAEWQIEKNITAATYATLNLLKNGYKHLIFKIYNGEGYLVRSQPYAYQFNYTESEGVLLCELSITNVSGMQRILSLAA